MKKNLQNAITTWITAAIVTVVGILCIIADNGNGANALEAYQNISIVLGITLMVVSGLGILLQGFVLRRTATSQSISNGIILAAGIYFVADKNLGGSLLSLFVEYVPYVLIVIGALIAVDAILILVFGLIKKEGLKAIIISFAIELAIAAVAIVLGVLALPSVGVITKKFTILGIIMIVYAAYLIFAGVLALLAGDKEDNADANANANAEEVNE